MDCILLQGNNLGFFMICKTVFPIISPFNCGTKTIKNIIPLGIQCWLATIKKKKITLATKYDEVTSFYTEITVLLFGLLLPLSLSFLHLFGYILVNF